VYHFRFESVLRLRRRELDQLQREFANVERKLLLEVSRLELFEKTKNHYAESLARRQAEGIDMRELGLYCSAIDKTESQVENQRMILHELNKTAEEKRQELLSAAQKKRILEKLKEYETEQYREEERRQERIQNDGFSANKIARAMSVWRDHEHEMKTTAGSEEAL
jgi:flagellar export protein FliJ